MNVIIYIQRKENKKMKGNKNTIKSKYTKIMLLALLIIASILSMYLVTNTNNKVFKKQILEK